MISWCAECFWHILAVFSFFGLIFYTWVKWNLSYWRRRGLSNPPTKFFFGNGIHLFTQKESFGPFSVDIYNFFKKRNEQHGGFYILLMPTYMPINLDIIKGIMQNDFNHFVDRGMYLDEDDDPLSAHLFSLEGAKWRSLRTKLTPTFTSGKMKMMFETLVRCGDQLNEEMAKNVSRAIDIKEMLGRYTTDVIGNCAFGIDCNSIKNPDNEFTKNMSLFFNDDLWENLVLFLAFIAPNFMRKFKVKAVKPKCAEFFMRVVRETTDYREKHNIYRKDFLHLLLQLKNRGELADDETILGDKPSDSSLTLTLNEIAAQAFVFFLAGFETSSTTMTFCLFELAQNPDIQDKLRDEINGVLSKQPEITYDCLMEMTYLEQVINETLRKYPPLPSLTRVCTKEYRVPETDIVIEKGTKVVIPVLGVHRDPEYYPDPEKFDPDRFSEKNKKNRKSFSFIPFGEGPRICIGLRFGMMQTKVGLVVLLRNYRFSLNQKTKLPIEFDGRSFVISTQGGIWLDYKKI